MIVEPEQRIADFAKAGADIISIHAEPNSTIHLDRTINMVRSDAAIVANLLISVNTIQKLIMITHGIPEIRKRLFYDVDGGTVSIS